LDLRFPHHENETAQSHAAGYEFANHWMHSAWVTLAGEKMSKSIGNVLGVQAVLQKLTPLELRFALASTHYRKNIEWSEDSIHQAQAAVKVFTEFLQKSAVKSSSVVGADRCIRPSDNVRTEAIDSNNDGNQELIPNSQFLTTSISQLPEAVRAALNDDLNTAEILEWLFKTVRSAEPATEQTVAQVRATLNILGCDPLDPHWSMGDSNSDREPKLQQTIRELVAPKLLNREQARRDKDFETADAIRLELEQLGLKLVDSPSGTEIEFES
jgi:cysteinyl-tRNA synthetase